MNLIVLFQEFQLWVCMGDVFSEFLISVFDVNQEAAWNPRSLCLVDHW